jgi:hypothetical protein
MTRTYFPTSSQKATTVLALAAGFLSLVNSASGQHVAQFNEVTSTAFPVPSPTPSKSWGNPIWCDINNDTKLDLIVPTHNVPGSCSGASCTACQVYKNNGDGTFTDMTSTSNIVGASGNEWRGFSVGDYDGDGNLDLYISVIDRTGGSKQDLLFQGNGDFTFTNVSSDEGIETSTQFGQSSLWFDYNKDGLLDLFVKNYNYGNNDFKNILYENNGIGHAFTAASNTGDLENATEFSGETGHGTNCAFADYNKDGDIDIVFTQDRTALYVNSSGVYTQTTEIDGADGADNGKGLAWGDYDNDGYLDLFIARGKLPGADGSLGTSLYRNNHSGTFTEVAQSAGVRTSKNTWSAVWGDYDNDGYLDLFITCSGNDETTAMGNGNFLCHNNNGNGTFTNVASQEHVQLVDNMSLHKTAAWGDYDGDGFLDLIVKDGIDGGPGTATTGGVHLFQNAGHVNGNTNHWVKIKLVGTASNLQGIGARVTVFYGSPQRKGFRQNDGGGGGALASQSNEPLHFGIGTAGSAMAKVDWPSGRVTNNYSLQIDTTNTVTEPAQ